MHEVRAFVLQPRANLQTAMRIAGHERIDFARDFFDRFGARQRDALVCAHRRLFGNPSGKQRWHVATERPKIVRLDAFELDVDDSARRGHENVHHVAGAMALERSPFGSGDGSRARHRLTVRVGRRIRLGLLVVLADFRRVLGLRDRGVEVRGHVHPANFFDRRALEAGLREDALRAEPRPHAARGDVFRHQEPEREHGRRTVPRRRPIDDRR